MKEWKGKGRQVSEYAKGKVEITVCFPNCEVVCAHCGYFLDYEREFRRFRCKLTHEQILDPYNYIGADCPLVFTEDKKDGHTIQDAASG